MKRKHIGRILVISAIIAGFAAGIMGVKPAAAATPISACGTINVPGSYFLTKSIGIAGDCIVIRASNVMFSLNGLNMVGNGKVGHGVIIANGATNVQVANGQISGWAVGVQDLGSQAQVHNLKILNNVLKGIALGGVTGSKIQGNHFPGNGAVAVELNATKGVTVSGNVSTGAGKYGVWVRSSSQFTISGNRISQDGIAGIFVGCTGHGITNALTCKRSTAGTIGGNVVVYSPHLGIAVDRGNTHIHVLSNHVSSSAKFDLFDANPGCGTNTWSGDVFGKSNQLCVK